MDPFQAIIFSRELIMKKNIKLSLITLCWFATLTASVHAKDVTIYYTNDLHAHVSHGETTHR